MMSFGNLFTHIGFSLDVYAEVFDGEIPKEEPETSPRKAKSEYLNRCFEHFETAYTLLKKNDITLKIISTQIRNLGMSSLFLISLC